MTTNNIYLKQKIQANGKSICQSCFHNKICRVIDNQPCIECNQYINIDEDEAEFIKCNNNSGYKCSNCKARVSNSDVLNGNHKYCYKCGKKIK